VLRAVADTNVVVSALLWRGAPHRLFDRLQRGRIEFFTSRSRRRFPGTRTTTR